MTGRRLLDKAIEAGAHGPCMAGGPNGACRTCVDIVHSIIDTEHEAKYARYQAAVESKSRTRGARPAGSAAVRRGR